MSFTRSPLDGNPLTPTGLRLCSTYTFLGATVTAIEREAILGERDRIRAAWESRYAQRDDCHSDLFAILDASDVT